jgi:flavin-binding protein dodecin
MAESVYKVIELVGTSTASWEKAAAAAVKLASQSLRDLRIAEVSELDMQITDGKVLAYRAKVKLSFKYTPGGESDAPAKAAKEAAPVQAKNGPRKAKRRPAKG